MLDALIALFEKPVSATSEVERQVLTRLLCNPAIDFVQPILDFKTNLNVHLAASKVPPSITGKAGLFLLSSVLGCYILTDFLYLVYFCQSIHPFDVTICQIN